MTILRPALVLLALFSALTGLLYPLLVTGFARVAFPHRAKGSLIIDEQGVRGSEWIGQSFDHPKYFWGRPSATTPSYNGGASSGSNLGPLNPAQLDAVKLRVAALRAADPSNAARVPVDLVTTSGSGLDPHITPAAALYQLHRVAKARGLSESRLRALVEHHVEGRDLLLLGERKVNVLRLNLALDRLAER